MARLARRTETDVVWDAVVSQLEMNPDYDHDGAVALADRARTLMERGAKYDEAERRAARRAARVERAKDIGQWAGVAVAALAVVAVNFWWIHAVASHNNRDYAGYGPKKAPVHASYAIQAWYGQNDLPPNLQLKGEQRSHIFGQDAWKVDYRAQNGLRVCAWVWLGRATPDARTTDLSRVATGKDCS